MNTKDKKYILTKEYLIPIWLEHNNNRFIINFDKMLNYDFSYYYYYYHDRISRYPIECGYFKTKFECRDITKYKDFISKSNIVNHNDVLVSLPFFEIFRDNYVLNIYSYSNGTFFNIKDLCPVEQNKSCIKCSHFCFQNLMVCKALSHFKSI